MATAPFYAVSGSPLLGWSSGGPRRDGHSRVLDTARNPIPGLYAAGAVSSTYSAAKDGGFHIADASHSAVSPGPMPPRVKLDIAGLSTD